eukprot:4743717-Amphidinium_carterae.1
MASVAIEVKNVHKHACVLQAGHGLRLRIARGCIGEHLQSSRIAVRAEEEGHVLAKHITPSQDSWLHKDGKKAASMKLV